MNPHRISPSTPIAPRQRAVLDAIRVLTSKMGQAPTLLDLCAATGIRSDNGIRCHLHALALKGYLTIQPRAARGIRLTAKGAT